MKIRLRQIIEENIFGDDIKNYLKNLKEQGNNKLENIIKFKKDQIKIKRDQYKTEQKIKKQHDDNDTVQYYNSKDSVLKK